MIDEATGPNQASERPATGAAELDYRLVLDSFSDAVIASGAPDQITYVNAAAERLLGRSRGDLLGSPLTSIMPVRLRAAHTAGLQRFLATHRARIMGKPIRVPALHQSGREVDVELTLSAFQLADGSDLLVASLRDLADRVELERQIATQRLLKAQYDAMQVMADASTLEAALPALLAAMGEPLGCDVALFWGVDDATSTLRIQAVWARVPEDFADFIADSRAAGYARGQGLPGSVWQSQGPIWRADVIADPRYQRTLSSGGPGLRGALLFPVASPGETYGVLEFVDRDVQEPSDELMQTMATVAFQICQFIDRLKQQRHLAERLRELETSRADLKAAVAARDEFLAIASHELRTPLTTLELQLDSLRGAVQAGTDNASEKIRRKVNTAVRQADRLEDLIEGLLDVSRIRTGHFSLALEDFDMAQLVGEVADRFAEQLTRSDCALQTAGAVSLPGRWDRTRVDQALSNLISNALKYAPGKPIEVFLHARGEQVELMVRDHGIGIAAEDLKRIFGQFERAVPAKHYGGLGLGLFIARQIAEAHGGSIEAHSDAERGTSFTLRLPRITLPGPGKVSLPPGSAEGVAP